MKMYSRKIDSPKGEIVLYELINARGSRVVLSSLGAGIISITVPDKNGEMADVLLGYENPLDYIGDGPCAGKILGRYANRIADGRFELGGETYHLPINLPPNSLHGGADGFQNRNWTSRAEGDDVVVFELVSADGDAGYPGELHVKVTYHWSDMDELSIRMEATTDKTTVLNLSNHAYFNLAGQSSGSGLGQVLWLGCSRWLPTDETLVPTGEMVTVAETPMDFTVPKAVGRDIKENFAALNYGKGYDNCWVVDGYEPGKIQTVAKLCDPTSGRMLIVDSDQPAVQMYSGNWLDGSPKGAGEYEYHDYDAVALECQDMPDAPNHSEFPSTVLKPGERYDRKIIFKFIAK